MQAFKKKKKTGLVLVCVYTLTHASTNDSYVTNSEVGLLWIQLSPGIMFFTSLKNLPVASLARRKSVLDSKLPTWKRLNLFTVFSKGTLLGTEGLLLRRCWNAFKFDECFFFCLCQTMSQSNFLLSLQSFPKDTINDEMVELLAPYLEMEDYNMETAKRVSNGCILGTLKQPVNSSDIYQVYFPVHLYLSAKF